MIARSEGVEYLDLIDAPFDSNDGNTSPQNPPCRKSRS